MKFIGTYLTNIWCKGFRWCVWQTTYITSYPGIIIPTREPRPTDVILRCLANQNSPNWHKISLAWFPPIQTIVWWSQDVTRCLFAADGCDQPECKRKRRRILGSGKKEESNISFEMETGQSEKSFSTYTCSGEQWNLQNFRSADPAAAWPMPGWLRIQEAASFLPPWPCWLGIVEPDSNRRRGRIPLHVVLCRAHAHHIASDCSLKLSEVLRWYRKRFPSSTCWSYATRLTGVYLMALYLYVGWYSKATGMWFLKLTV